MVTVEVLKICIYVFQCHREKKKSISKDQYQFLIAFHTTPFRTQIQSKHFLEAGKLNFRIPSGNAAWCISATILFPLHFIPSTIFIQEYAKSLKERRRQMTKTS